MIIHLSLLFVVVSPTDGSLRVADFYSSVDGQIMNSFHLNVVVGCRIE